MNYNTNTEIVNPFVFLTIHWNTLFAFGGKTHYNNENSETFGVLIRFISERAEKYPFGKEFVKWTTVQVATAVS